jgi:hypothetical protein
MTKLARFFVLGIDTLEGKIAFSVGIVFSMIAILNLIEIALSFIGFELAFLTFRAYSPLVWGISWAISSIMLYLSVFLIGWYEGFPLILSETSFNTKVS